MIIGNGFNICVLRFQSNNLNISKLISYFNDENSLDDFLLKGSDAAFSVVYYKNLGNNMLVNTVYNENLKHNERFNAQKRYIVPSTQYEFKSSKMKIYIFEALFESNEGIALNFSELCDPVNFIYFRILGSLLIKRSIEFSFLLLCQNEQDDYISLTDEDCYKLRSFLCLNPKDINDRILVLRKTWCRLYDDDNLGTLSNLGKISPLFEISYEIYQQLQRDVSYLGKENVLFDVYNHYITELKGFIEDYEIKINMSEYCTNDSLMDILLFLFTLVYIIKDYEKEYEDVYKEAKEQGLKISAATKKQFIKEKMSNADFTILHERCLDYAQGIIQLIENALYHAIGQNKNGIGLWCIRIRDKQNVFALNKETNSYDNKYFMEVYVFDYDFKKDQNKGIVNKFYSNINHRLRTINKELFPDEYDCLKRVSDSEKSKDAIILENLFGIGWKESKLSEYLRFPENIAYHYGLQILDNVVLSGNGCLYVKSGQDYQTKGQTEFINMGIPWSQGTAYVIYLPIKDREYEKTSYWDSIDKVDEGKYSIEFKEINHNDLLKNICAFDFPNTPSEKNTIIGKLVEKISADKTHPNNIVIDCSPIKNYWHCEILAKVIFLCLSKTSYENIALINLSNSREVIKLFRQFALFYNRQGENHIMSRKSIFITDGDAKIDILIQGKIKDIKSCLHRGQICGGIDEDVIKIIDYLGERNSTK